VFFLSFWLLIVQASYLTYLDKYLLMSLVWLVTCVIEVAVASGVCREDVDGNYSSIYSSSSNGGGGSSCSGGGVGGDTVCERDGSSESWSTTCAATDARFHVVVGVAWACLHACGIALLPRLRRPWSEVETQNSVLSVTSSRSSSRRPERDSGGRLHKD
jgi:hypothetical protein